MGTVEPVSNMEMSVEMSDMSGSSWNRRLPGMMTGVICYNDYEKSLRAVEFMLFELQNFRVFLV